MPAILLFVSDGDEDARRFAALDDGHHWIRLGLPEIWVQKLIAPVFGCFQNRSAPFLRSVQDPVLELSGDVRSTSRLTGYIFRYVWKKPITRSGCWNGWIHPCSNSRSKHRYPKAM